MKKIIISILSLSLFFIMENCSDNDNGNALNPTTSSILETWNRDLHLVYDNNDKIIVNVKLDLYSDNKFETTSSGDFQTDSVGTVNWDINSITGELKPCVMATEGAYEINYDTITITSQEKYRYRLNGNGTAFTDDNIYMYKLINFKNDDYFSFGFPGGASTFKVISSSGNGYEGKYSSQYIGYVKTAENSEFILTEGITSTLSLNSDLTFTLSHAGTATDDGTSYQNVSFSYYGTHSIVDNVLTLLTGSVDLISNTKIKLIDKYLLFDPYTKNIN